MDRYTWLVLFFAVAGLLITGAFLGIWLFYHGAPIWAIAAFISSGYTLGYLRIEMQKTRRHPQDY